MSEIDINNLNQDDFLEMARYVQYLEEQLVEKDKSKIGRAHV